MDPTRPPSPLTPKLGGRLRERWSKLFRRSPSAPLLHQPSQAPSAQSDSPSLSPNGQLGLTFPNSSPALTDQVVFATRPPVRTSLSVPDVRTPTPGPRDETLTVAISVVAANSSSVAHDGANLATPVSLASASQPTTSGPWAGLSTTLRTLRENAHMFPPLQSAIDTLIPCLGILEEAARNRRQYEELASELTSLIELLTQHMQQSNAARMSDSIANVARSIKEQAKLIENKRARNIRRRLVEANVDEEELGMYYRRIATLFRQLQADANLSIWNLVNDQTANTRLKRLKPVMLANHDSMLSEGISRRTCTANTRTAILSGLNDWSCDPSGADLYWMNGMAGTGKTTIACSFSESLEERKQLAASFFCARTVPECHEVGRIIPTIAYQLARYSVPFQSVLCETLGEDPDISSKNMTKQFDRLLKNPLLKVKEAMPSDLVVVIDALDECDDMREVELLLAIILKSVAELPIKFFVTSRPEPGIYSRMLTRSYSSRATLHLHEVEKSLVQADIEVYLEEELEFMSPAPAQIKELARRSGNLFIYAATLVRYIRSRKPHTDPQRRLQAVLDMTSEPTRQYATIDALYAAVLRAALDDESGELEAQEIEDVRHVLQTVICVQEPVSVKVLAVLAGIDNEQRVLSALQPLRSVLHFSETTRLVSTLHTSFPDFMFDETRSKPFFFSLAECSQLLAQRCFEVMKAQLQFNICKLESSFVPDNKVDDLEDRISRAISPVLWYACRHWSDHLQYSAYSDSLRDMLRDFLSVRLLFWMEVLNLKKGIGLGIEVLLRAKLWLKIGTVPSDLVRLTVDARNFVTSFAANPVSQCTPHIYISLLPFCSKSSSVFEQYWKKTCALIDVSGSVMQRRDAAALASWKTESEVLSAAYSPDGSCLAVGCEDGTLSTRNAHDGMLVAGPFKGHTGSVGSVAYSPDGMHIASGSKDRTIQVRSAHDGTLITRPFEGHTGSVWSVAYSPDGTHIVSGSQDCTIRVWNAHDGTLTARLFHGHVKSVSSVAYSPDGIYIVSGSDDCTIRVWSALNGTLVASPFEGHTDSVLSVAYSPDGTRIVSGSDDGTIRVWNAQDGTLVVSPFEGHTGSVWSVAYSPDGTHIVSGSEDRTIRVWSAHDGILAASPYKGHTDVVFSVVYSPDGTRIISGSDDGTIRVWNAHRTTFIDDAFEGHTDFVWSVGYSPDGACIVSGSSDHTIRVWNARDGTLIAGPFQGHTDSVWSVAYSPDGTRIVSGSDDLTIRVWRVHDGQLLASPFQGHAGSIWSVAYSPNGTHIVSGSKDHTIRVWNAYNGTLTASPFKGHTGSVWSVAYSPDGAQIVSGSDDCTIRVWSAHDGSLVAGPFVGHTESVFSVAYSPDGMHIVSGSGDCTIRVWSALGGSLIAGPFEGHADSVFSVSYSPDGTCIASGSKDCTIRVWNAHDGSLVTGPFEGHTNVAFSIAYSPDGTHVISGSHDDTIRAWRTISSPPVDNPLTIIPVDTSVAPLSRLSTHSSIIHLTDQSNITHTPSCNLVLDRWTISHDGWVMSANAQLLFWVPSEFSWPGALSTFYNPLIIAPHGSLHIDYSNVFLGEHWDKCYKLE